MEYILTQIFGQTARVAGPVMGLVVTLAFGLIAVALYKAKKTIDLDDRKEQAREQERMVEMQGRERERQAMVNELAATRAQVHQFLTNHLEHLRVETEKDQTIQQDTALSLQKVAQALDAVATKLDGHSNESRASFSKLYDKVDTVKDAVRK